MPKRPSSDHSYFSLVNVNGTYAIREFHAGTSGEVFTFPLLKTIQNKIADLHSGQATRLPIETNGQ